MAKDVFLRCMDEAITRLHYLNFVITHYIEKLSSDDRHNTEYIEKLKELREGTIKIHNHILDFYDNTYIKDQKHPSSYNPLFKKVRKGTTPVTFENYPDKVRTVK